MKKSDETDNVELPRAPSFEESMAILRDAITSKKSLEAIKGSLNLVNAQTLNRIACALEALLAKIDTLV